VEKKKENRLFFGLWDVDTSMDEVNYKNLNQIKRLQLIKKSFGGIE